MFFQNGKKIPTLTLTTLEILVINFALGPHCNPQQIDVLLLHTPMPNQRFFITKQYSVDT